MISEIFYKITYNLDLYQANTMRNEKVLEFLTFTHSSRVRVGENAEKRVPIDNIRASGSRRQAKRRCLLSEC